MNKNLKKLFEKIKLLILDVDGVLTAGEIIYDNEGRELKIFNVKDGFGIYLLNKVGIKTVFLTARDSNAVKKRALDMDVEVIAGILPKERVLEDLILKYKVNKEEICFIGDDLIDLGLMEKVGVGIAVKDAVSAIKRQAIYITHRKGGEGAVREVVDLILKAKKLDKKIYELIREIK